MIIGNFSGKQQLENFITYKLEQNGESPSLQFNILGHQGDPVRRPREAYQVSAALAADKDLTKEDLGAGVYKDEHGLP